MGSRQPSQNRLISTLKVVYFFATVFNLNEPERQLLAEPTLPEGMNIRVIFPLFWCTKYLLVSIQRAYRVLDKIRTHGIFKLLSYIYLQNMCIVTCDF